MPRGVPENEVLAAADRVLARGERPTVEKVRAELGRGSPARVGQLLDSWWDALAKRLAGETRLPDLPADVARAFRAVWESAIQEGRAQTEALLTERQQALADERTALHTERERFEATLSEAQVACQQSDHARELAEARSGELERLSRQQAAQIEDLQSQRDALQRRAGQLESELTALVDKHHLQEENAAEERRVQSERIRIFEDRAHAEIDRARQESKAVRQHSTELQRRLRSLEQALSAALKREATLQNKIAKLQQPTQKRPSVAGRRKAPRSRNSRAPAIN
ncbi:MAG TPA: DNA-binding protein [Acidobacteriaceae bacterium]|nr:DNA-binding protein [Acidobacteriaceae bacterium]